MTVDIFIPCFIDQIYPETGLNMVKVLRKADVDVHYNTNQTCCGQMAFNSGFWDDARKIGQKFLKDFPNNRYIVVPSASCAGFIRNYYPKLFKETKYAEECDKLVKNIYEFTDFLVNVLKITDFNAIFENKITYHDACAALREYGIKEEPRILLNKVKGLEIAEMKENDVCCGFGGTFSVKFEPISTAMGEQKILNALETGAKFIVSTEASCLMHLEGYIQKHKIDLKTMHIADVLAQGW